MSNSGQTCAAPTRTLVPRALKDEFTELVRQAVAALTVGDPCTGVDLGPVASEASGTRCSATSSLASRKELTSSSAAPASQTRPARAGSYVRPCLPTSRIAREEIFGPVMSLIWYETVDQAVEIANDSPYGLVAYVQGSDADLVRDVASRLRAGQVIVNSGYPDLTAPFRGYKQSGNGRIWGNAAALDEYLETKAIVGALVTPDASEGSSR